MYKVINFTFQKGKIYSITGPSGSGKSTLLNLISLIDKPNNGNVVINNVDTTKIENDQKDILRSEKIGIIYQDKNLLSDFSAFENVYLPNLLISKEKQKSEELANKIIKIPGTNIVASTSLDKTIRFHNCSNMNREFKFIDLVS